MLTPIMIELREYASRFALAGLPIVKVGINFDAERHTLGDWKIESLGCHLRGEEEDEEECKVCHVVENGF